MKTGQEQTGFSALELLIVVLAIVVLASILFPVFATSRCGGSRKSTCISQVRQLATAVQMYAQDNKGQYPGTDWVNQITSYVGASSRMFACPSDTMPTSGSTSMVSYGYAGLLVRHDGTGVTEASVLSLSEIGCVCDAAPSKPYPSGGLVGGGALRDPAVWGVTPQARHSKGTVAGYCDGHAKYLPGVPAPRDMANGINRAFFQVAPLGLIDNPVGCLGAGPVTGGNGPTITVGGDFAMQPFLMAAAKLHGLYFTKGFLGQYAVKGRPRDYAWGVGDGVKPAGRSVAIARDAVLVIVSKGSKIPSLGAMSNGAYTADYPKIRALFAAGYVDNSIQVYTLSPLFGTRRFFTRHFGVNGTPMSIGKEAVEVANDAEVVDKVSNDPYGIGYCSSAFFDPDRVTALTLQAPGGKTYIYPNNSPKYRWVLPPTLNYPLARTLYLTFSGKAWPASGPGFGPDHFAPGAATLRELHHGPYFHYGFWKP